MLVVDRQRVGVHASILEDSLHRVNDTINAVPAGLFQNGDRLLAEWSEKLTEELDQILLPFVAAHLSATRGVLAGSSPTDRYNDFFVTQLSTPLLQLELDTVLVSIRSHAENFCVSLIEAVVVLVTDLHEMQDWLGRSFSISRVTWNLGDSHNSGRHVIGFGTTEEDSFYYKPRPGTGEHTLCDLIEFFFPGLEHGGPRFSV